MGFPGPRDITNNIRSQYVKWNYIPFFQFANRQDLLQNITSITTQTPDTTGRSSEKTINEAHEQANKINDLYTAKVLLTNPGRLDWDNVGLRDIALLVSNRRLLDACPSIISKGMFQKPDYKDMAVTWYNAHPRNFVHKGLGYPDKEVLLRKIQQTTAATPDDLKQGFLDDLKKEGLLKARTASLNNLTVNDIKLPFKSKKNVINQEFQELLESDLFLPSVFTTMSIARGLGKFIGKTLDVALWVGDTKIFTTLAYVGTAVAAMKLGAPYFLAGLFGGAVSLAGKFSIKTETTLWLHWASSSINWLNKKLCWPAILLGTGALSMILFNYNMNIENIVKEIGELPAWGVGGLLFHYVSHFLRDQSKELCIARGGKVFDGTFEDSKFLMKTAANAFWVGGAYLGTILLFTVPGMANVLFNMVTYFGWSTFVLAFPVCSFIWAEWRKRQGEKLKKTERDKHFTNYLPVYGALGGLAFSFFLGMDVSTEAGHFPIFFHELWQNYTTVTFGIFMFFSQVHQTGFSMITNAGWMRNMKASIKPIIGSFEIKKLVAKLTYLFNRADTGLRESAVGTRATVGMGTPNPTLYQYDTNPFKKSYKKIENPAVENELIRRFEQLMTFIMPPRFAARGNSTYRQDEGRLIHALCRQAPRSVNSAHLVRSLGQLVALFINPNYPGYGKDANALAEKISDLVDAGDLSEDVFRQMIRGFITSTIYKTHEDEMLGWIAQQVRAGTIDVRVDNNKHDPASKEGHLTMNRFIDGLDQTEKKIGKLNKKLRKMEGKAKRAENEKLIKDLQEPRQAFVDGMALAETYITESAKQAKKKESEIGTLQKQLAAAVEEANRVKQLGEALKNAEDVLERLNRSIAMNKDKAGDEMLEAKKKEREIADLRKKLAAADKDPNKVKQLGEALKKAEEELAKINAQIAQNQNYIKSANEGIAKIDIDVAAAEAKIKAVDALTKPVKLAIRVLDTMRKNDIANNRDYMKKWLGTIFGPVRDFAQRLAFVEHVQERQKRILDAVVHGSSGQNHIYGNMNIATRYNRVITNIRDAAQELSAQTDYLPEEFRSHGDWYDIEDPEFIKTNINALRVKVRILEKCANELEDAMDEGIMSQELLEDALMLNVRLEGYDSNRKAMIECVMRKVINGDDGAVNKDSNIASFLLFRAMHLYELKYKEIDGQPCPTSDYIAGNWTRVLNPKYSYFADPRTFEGTPFLWVKLDDVLEATNRHDGGPTERLTDRNEFGSTSPLAERIENPPTSVEGFERGRQDVTLKVSDRDVAFGPGTSREYFWLNDPDNPGRAPSIAHSMIVLRKPVTIHGRKTKEVTEQEFKALFADKDMRDPVFTRSIQIELWDGTVVVDKRGNIIADQAEALIAKYNDQIPDAYIQAIYRTPKNKGRWDDKDLVVDSPVIFWYGDANPDSKAARLIPYNKSPDAFRESHHVGNKPLIGAEAEFNNGVLSGFNLLYLNAQHKASDKKGNDKEKRKNYKDWTKAQNDLVKKIAKCDAALAKLAPKAAKKQKQVTKVQNEKNRCQAELQKVGEKINGITFRVTLKKSERPKDLGKLNIQIPAQGQVTVPIYVSDFQDSTGAVCLNTGSPYVIWDSREEIFVRGTGNRDDWRAQLKRQKGDKPNCDVQGFMFAARKAWFSLCGVNINEPGRRVDAVNNGGEKWITKDDQYSIEKEKGAKRVRKNIGAVMSAKKGFKPFVIALPWLGGAKRKEASQGQHCKDIFEIVNSKHKDHVTAKQRRELNLGNEINASRMIYKLNPKGLMGECKKKFSGFPWENSKVKIVDEGKRQGVEILWKSQSGKVVTPIFISAAELMRNNGRREFMRDWGSNTIKLTANGVEIASGRKGSTASVLIPAEEFVNRSARERAKEMIKMLKIINWGSDAVTTVVDDERGKGIEVVWTPAGMTSRDPIFIPAEAFIDNYGKKLMDNSEMNVTGLDHIFQSDRYTPETEEFRPRIEFYPDSGLSLRVDLMDKYDVKIDGADYEKLIEKAGPGFQIFPSAAYSAFHVGEGWLPLNEKVTHTHLLDLSMTTVEKNKVVSAVNAQNRVGFWTKLVIKIRDIIFYGGEEYTSPLTRLKKGISFSLEFAKGLVGRGICSGRSTVIKWDALFSRFSYVEPTNNPNQKKIKDGHNIMGWSIGEDHKSAEEGIYRFGKAMEVLKVSFDTIHMLAGNIEEAERKIGAWFNQTAKRYIFSEGLFINPFRLALAGKMSSALLGRRPDLVSWPALAEIAAGRFWYKYALAAVMQIFAALAYILSGGLIALIPFDQHVIFATWLLNNLFSPFAFVVAFTTLGFGYAKAFLVGFILNKKIDDLALIDNFNTALTQYVERNQWANYFLTSHGGPFKFTGFRLAVSVIMTAAVSTALIYGSFLFLGSFAFGIGATTFFLGLLLVNVLAKWHYSVSCDYSSKNSLEDVKKMEKAQAKYGVLGKLGYNVLGKLKPKKPAFQLSRDAIMNNHKDPRRQYLARFDALKRYAKRFVGQNTTTANNSRNPFAGISYDEIFALRGQMKRVLVGMGVMKKDGTVTVDETSEVLDLSVQLLEYYSNVETTLCLMARFELDEDPMCGEALSVLRKIALESKDFTVGYVAQQSLHEVSALNNIEDFEKGEGEEWQGLAAATGAK